MTSDPTAEVTGGRYIQKRWFFRVFLTDLLLVPLQNTLQPLGLLWPLRPLQPPWPLQHFLALQPQLPTQAL